MKPNQLSPVIIRFKALPDVPVVAVAHDFDTGDICQKCALDDHGMACGDEAMTPSGYCIDVARRYERV